MTSQGDDVGALFKSFGADDRGFRELARSADAGEAEERWPLLKSIAPEKRGTPPALSDLQKNQIWNKQERPAPRMRAAVPVSTGMGQKLAASLQQMGTRAAPESVPVKPAARAAVEAQRPQAAPLFAPVSVPVAAPLFAPKAAPAAPVRVSNLFARPAVSAEAANPIPKTRSMFAQVEAAQTPVPAQLQPAASTADSLSSVFKRLAGNDETVAAPSANRPSFLGRLGRR